MPWLEILLPIGLIAIVIFTVWLLRHETEQAAQKSEQAKVSKEALDAMRREREGEAASRALSRSERLNRLLRRARRRAAGRVSGDE